MGVYVQIVKWRDFQHYKDRSPPWIKLHRDLLTSRTWVGGSNETRTLAVACMLLAAATENFIPLDTAYIKRVAYLDFEPDFGQLLDTQFVELVDERKKVLARCSRDASKVLSREETTTEAEISSPSLRSGDAHSIPNPPSLPETPNPDSGNTGKGVTSRGARKGPMPSDFGISERVRAWAEERGLNHLDQHLEAFRAKAAARGYRYVDWDAAFMEAIREDWAGLRSRAAPDGNQGVIHEFLESKGLK